MPLCWQVKTRQFFCYDIKQKQNIGQDQLVYQTINSVEKEFNEIWNQDANEKKANDELGFKAPRSCHICLLMDKDDTDTLELENLANFSIVATDVGDTS